MRKDCANCWRSINRIFPRSLQLSWQIGGDQPIRDLQAVYTSQGQEYTRQQALLAEQAANLRSEAAQTEDEIHKLRTGDREVSFESEAPQASRLRRLLRAALGLASEEVVFLCTLLNIPDKEWQDAVEGILGQNRFAILVPPAAYDAAMRLYQQRRHKDGLHGVALLDTEAILRHTPRPASLRNLVTGCGSEHRSPCRPRLSTCSWGITSSATPSTGCRAPPHGGHA